MKFFLESDEIRWPIVSLDHLDQIRVNAQHADMTIHLSSGTLNLLNARIVDETGVAYSEEEFLRKWRDVNGEEQSDGDR